MPRTVASAGRMKFWPRSNSCLFRKLRAGKRQLQDRHSRGVVVEDQRRGDARRHLLQHGLRERSDLRGRGADIGAGLEEDLDDADARQGLALDMFDIVDGRARAGARNSRSPGRPYRRAAGRDRSTPPQ